jgi:hypothetical protein
MHDLGKTCHKNIPNYIFLNIMPLNHPSFAILNSFDNDVNVHTKKTLENTQPLMEQNLK